MRVWIQRKVEQSETCDSHGFKIDIFKDPFLSKFKGKEREVRERIGDNRGQWGFFVPDTQSAPSWRCLCYLICKSVWEF